MKGIARHFRTVMSLTAVAALLLVATAQAQLPAPGSLPAPVTTPSAEQLRMLGQLPESERQAVMRALGITDLDLQQQQPADDLRLQQAAPVPSQTSEEGEPIGPPILEARSTVIVKLRLPYAHGDPTDIARRARSQAVEPVSGSSQAIDDEQRELQELARLESSGLVDPEVERLFQQRVLRNSQLGLLLGTATYELDDDGRIRFPGVATIALAGLTEQQAARRIEAESSLRPLVAEVTLLPLERFGVDALEPFGYALFQDLAVTFFPATDVPVPAEYTIGPGDEVRVQLFGKQNVLHNLAVTREGHVNFPGIGPISVAGQSFGNVRELIQERVSEQMIGVTASVTMGELRSIRVFVLGDVERPGSYVVTGLSTATNALFVSGGVAESGSLRRVQLKRGGRTVQTLDVYDMLLRGDSSRDARLQSNDVLFVPPRGPTVA
ncbi:MAG: polysaccharide biosynthesis/export family protein, partial [Pseudomonadota bacterium]|nr:polysaccharide biosynthesis/export family protein [Pseudomonadota bacterium]